MRQEDCEFEASLDYIRDPISKKKKRAGPVILATQEAEIRMWFQANLDKQFTRPYLKKSHHKEKRLVE
jgi:hypothetical protein